MCVYLQQNGFSGNTTYNGTMASLQISENFKNGVFTQWLHKEAGVPDCTLTMQKLK
jgi:hypothetical protein